MPPQDEFIKILGLRICICIGIAFCFFFYSLKRTNFGRFFFCLFMAKILFCGWERAERRDLEKVFVVIFFFFCIFMLARL